MAEMAMRGPLLPGASIGILGGGQLGRMLAMAAARLGLKTHIYTDTAGPARDVAAETTIAAYDDWERLAAFAATVAVVTYEFENVPERPGTKALAVAQDRLVEKTFMTGLGIAVAPFVAVDTAADIEPALARMPAGAILKSRRLGYDGKGQVNIPPGGNAAAAFAAIGAVPAIIEARLSFLQEVAVLAVRAGDGSFATYDIPQNCHAGGILRRSVVPAPLPEATVARAREIAGRIAGALDYVGLLAVEMFDLGPEHAPASRLVVNEIAPRVHNSGHWTLDACPVSQFENHIRAVAGWPLGTTERHSDCEMHNLIGDEVLAWRDLAGDGELCLHLYGKGHPREGRKMGHTTRLFPRGTRRGG